MKKALPLPSTILVLLLAISLNLMAQPIPTTPSIQSLQEAAEKGDPTSQDLLGLKYKHGEGVPHDDAAAIAWFKKSADQGSPRGERDLASMYFAGQGVPKDPKIAQALFTKAAQAGDKASQDIMVKYKWATAGSFSAATPQTTPTSTPQQANATNSEAAINAAIQAGPAAETALGLMYRNGKGVPVDYGVSARLFKLAADQGNTEAMDNLASQYDRAQGLPESPEDGFRLYLKSAQLGSKWATGALTHFLQSGFSYKETKLTPAECDALLSKVAAKGDDKDREEAVKLKAMAAPMQPPATTVAATPASSATGLPPPARGGMEVSRLVESAYHDLLRIQAEDASTTKHNYKASALWFLKNFAEEVQIKVRGGDLSPNGDSIGNLHEALKNLDRVTLAYPKTEYISLRNATWNIKKAIEAYQHLDSEDAMIITVNNTPVKVTQLGKGPIGVIFFNNSGQMDASIIKHSKTYSSLLNDYTFFLWSYPQTAPFDQVEQAIRGWFMNTTRSRRIDLSGIATSVVDQIEKQSQLKQFLVVGNSLGAGVVLWDYKTLSLRPELKFLLISPTQTFSPHDLGDLTNTILISAPSDSFVEDSSMKAWCQKNNTPPSVTSSAASFHLILGQGLSHSKLCQLIPLAATGQKIASTSSERIEPLSDRQKDYRLSGGTGVLLKGVGSWPAGTEVSMKTTRKGVASMLVGRELPAAKEGQAEIYALDDQGAVHAIVIPEAAVQELQPEL